MNAERRPLLAPELEEIQPSFRERVGHTLETSALHKTVITLITIDAACVLADLSYNFLSSSCETPEGPEDPLWLEILAGISISITSFFLIEIPLAIYAFGTAYYNPWARKNRTQEEQEARGEELEESSRSYPHASFHLFDALIIITTFILEFILKGKERELAGLLIVLRLWRLVKLVGGIAVGAGELEEEYTKRMVSKQEELAAALFSSRREADELRQRIRILEGDSSS